LATLLLEIKGTGSTDSLELELPAKLCQLAAALLDLSNIAFGIKKGAVNTNRRELELSSVFCQDHATI
jgi:hypothetical protein